MSRLIMLVFTVMLISCAPARSATNAAAPDQLVATATRIAGSPEPEAQRAVGYAREVFRTRYGNDALDKARVEVQPTQRAWMVVFHEKDNATYFCVERGTSRILLSSEGLPDTTDTNNPCDNPAQIERPAPRPATPPAGGPGG